MIANNMAQIQTRYFENLYMKVCIKQLHHGWSLQVPSDGYDQHNHQHNATQPPAR